MNIVSWKSLPDFVSELQGRYKILNQEFPLNKTLALDFGIYVLRQLGTPANTPDLTYAKIEDYILKIPTNINEIEGVYLANTNCPTPQTSAWHEGHLYPLKFVKGLNSNILCSNSDCRKATGTKTFSINPPHLIFNFTNEYVIIDAWKFYTDENSIPMIPDIESVKKCIENYIVVQWLDEAALLKKDINYNYLLKKEDDYHRYFGQAKADLIMPTQLEAREFMNSWNRQLDKFKIR